MSITNGVLYFNTTNVYKEVSKKPQINCTVAITSRNTNTKYWSKWQVSNRQGWLTHGCRISGPRRLWWTAATKSFGARQSTIIKNISTENAVPSVYRASTMHRRKTHPGKVWGMARIPVLGDSVLTLHRETQFTMFCGLSRRATNLPPDRKSTPLDFWVVISKQCRSPDKKNFAG